MQYIFLRVTSLRTPSASTETRRLVWAIRHQTLLRTSLIGLRVRMQALIKATTIAQPPEKEGSVS
eukprot:scaffold62511_cov35-Attheya_sp.AAC.1